VCGGGEIRGTERGGGELWVDREREGKRRKEEGADKNSLVKTAQEGIILAIDKNSQRQGQGQRWRWREIEKQSNAAG
jgi:hypothetical protein